MAKATLSAKRRLTLDEIATICSALRHWQNACYSDLREECLAEFGADSAIVGSADINDLIAALFYARKVKVWRSTPTQP